MKYNEQIGNKGFECKFTAKTEAGKVDFFSIFMPENLVVNQIFPTHNRLTAASPRVNILNFKDSTKRGFNPFCGVFAFRPEIKNSYANKSINITHF